MPKHLVRVRALSNVLGLRHGDVVDVIATPRVETLIRGGHLEWVDEAGAKVEYVEAADEELTSVPMRPITQAEEDEDTSAFLPPAEKPKLRSVKVTKRSAADDE